MWEASFFRFRVERSFIVYTEKKKNKEKEGKGHYQVTNVEGRKMTIAENDTHALYLLSLSLPPSPFFPPLLSLFSNVRFIII